MAVPRRVVIVVLVVQTLPVADYSCESTNHGSHARQHRVPPREGPLQRSGGKSDSASPPIRACCESQTPKTRPRLRRLRRSNLPCFLAGHWQPRPVAGSLLSLLARFAELSIYRPLQPTRPLAAHLSLRPNRGARPSRRSHPREWAA